MRFGKIKSLSLCALLLGSGGCCTINLHPDNDEYGPVGSESNPFVSMANEITLNGYEYYGGGRNVQTRDPIDHRLFIFKYRYPWQEDAFKVFHLKKKK